MALEIRSIPAAHKGDKARPGCFYWLNLDNAHAKIASFRAKQAEALDSAVMASRVELAQEIDALRRELDEELPHVRLEPISVGEMNAVRATTRALGQAFEVTATRKGDARATMVGDPHAREMGLARKLIRTRVHEVRNVVLVDGGERRPITTGAELVQFIDDSQDPMLAGLISELFLALTQASTLERGLGEA